MQSKDYLENVSPELVEEFFSSVVSGDIKSIKRAKSEEFGTVYKIDYYALFDVPGYDIYKAGNSQGVDTSYIASFGLCAVNEGGDLVYSSVISDIDYRWAKVVLSSLNGDEKANFINEYAMAKRNSINLEYEEGVKKLEEKLAEKMNSVDFFKDKLVFDGLEKE